jgi:hypothetical protein
MTKEEDLKQIDQLFQKRLKAELSGSSGDQCSGDQSFDQALGRVPSHIKNNEFYIFSLLV